MKKTYENDNAITIVGLVITIIVTLIIAGISIAILLGEGGIIKQAKSAKDNTKKSSETENKMMEKHIAKINEITSGNLNKNEDTDKEETDHPKGNAKQIKENAKNTYGKEVSNYVVKEAKNKEIQADKDVKWKIFYANDENVYLIADSYVKNTSLPYSRILNKDGTTSNTENLPNKFIGEDLNCKKGEQYRAHFVNVINSYSGMDRILLDRVYGNSLKNINSKYFNMFPAGKVENSNKKYENNKAVAYMLDTEAWSIYKVDQQYADYAIGGPTLEMLYDSYIQTHPKVEGKYKYTFTGENKEQNSEGATGSGYAGYQISWDGGTIWKTWTDNSAGYLSADTDNLYVVDPQHEKSYAYWIASPSAVNDENIMLVYYYGRIRAYYYNNELVAFRPIVCLSSNVTLELNEMTQKYEIKQ